MRKLPKMPKPKSLPTKHRVPIKKTTARRAGSNVIAHEYDPQKLELDVTFHGGRKYRYHGVLPSQFEAFGNAESRGAYLHKHIIGIHKVQKL